MDDGNRKGGENLRSSFLVDLTGTGEKQTHARVLNKIKQTEPADQPRGWATVSGRERMITVPVIEGEVH